MATSYPPWESPGLNTSQQTKKENVQVRAKARLEQENRRRIGTICLTDKRIIFEPVIAEGDDREEIEVCRVDEIVEVSDRDGPRMSSNWDLSSMTPPEVGNSSYHSPMNSFTSHHSRHSNPSPIPTLSASLSLTSPSKKGGFRSSGNVSKFSNLGVCIYHDDFESEIFFTSRDARADRDKFRARLALSMVEWKNNGNSTSAHIPVEHAASFDNKQTFANSDFDKSEVFETDTRGRAETMDASCSIETSRSITTTGIHVGARVDIHDTATGVLRYCGPVHFMLGEYCGIELDIPHGSSDGRVGKHRYFKCRGNHAIFVAVQHVSENEKEKNVVTSVREPKPKLLLSRPDWIEEATRCNVCHEEFSAIKRRHHCRNCGSLCCNSCSPHKRVILYLGYFAPERVCKTCDENIALFTLATGIQKKGGKKVGPVKGYAAKQAQLKALDEIADQIIGPKCFQYVHSGLINLVLMLGTLPEEKVKCRAVSIILSLAEKGKLQMMMVKSGVVSVLNAILKGETEEAMLVNAARALLLLCENRNHRLAITRTGIAGVLLLHLTEPLITLNNAGTQIVALLCEDTVCQQLICTAQSGQQLFRLLALTSEVSDPACQQNMLLAIAHITTSPANARRCFNANVILCDIFRPTVAKLLADEFFMNTAEDASRKMSLAHAACALANLSVLGEWDVNRTMLCGSLSMLAKLIVKLSEEFEEHLSRGLSNVSCYPLCVDTLLRSLKHVIPALRVYSSRMVTKCSILKMLNNLMVLNPNDTSAKLMMESDMSEILRELILTEKDNVVGALAHRLHLALGGQPFPELDFLDTTPDVDQLYQPESAPPSSFTFTTGTPSKATDFKSQQQPSLRDPRSSNKDKRRGQLFDRLTSVQKQRELRIEELHRISDASEDPTLRGTVSKLELSIQRRVDRSRNEQAEIRTLLMMDKT
eukprot:m.226458 g.226458  ORF g.226458 m.226458 type:complete len:932 (+) comp33492_c0_seq2:302-3097(+)